MGSLSQQGGGTLDSASHTKVVLRFQRAILKLGLSCLFLLDLCLSFKCPDKDAVIEVPHGGLGLGGLLLG